MTTVDVKTLKGVLEGSEVSEVEGGDTMLDLWLTDGTAVTIRAETPYEPELPRLTFEVSRPEV